MERETDIAWAAGFLDGEGCLTISRWKNRHYARITTNQKFRAPLDRLVTIFGFGSVRKIKDERMPARHLWRLTWDHRQAEKVCRACCAQFTIKREQAKAILAFQWSCLRFPRNRWNPLTTWELAQRDWHYWRLRELKHAA